MEYLAAGDVSEEGVHILSTGGMLAHARATAGGADGEAGAREAVVATEIGMLYPLQMAAPQVNFIPANAEASCRYMKMITLPKLRDSLANMRFEVRVPEDVAQRARVPIDRMVAIG
jgi:quinolinate synthase